MIGWLYRFLVGWFTPVKPCQHKWKVEKQVPVVYTNNQVIKYIDVYLSCEHCGRWDKQHLE